MTRIKAAGVAGGHRSQYRVISVQAWQSQKGIIMDAIFLCAGLAFFAATIGYVLICERL